jgi:hypothetical protein
VFCLDGNGLERTPLTGGRGRPLESRDGNGVFVAFSFVTVAVVVVVVGGEERLGGGVGVVGDAGSALVEKDLARGEDGACA